MSEKLTESELALALANSGPRKPRPLSIIEESDDDGTDTSTASSQGPVDKETGTGSDTPPKKEVTRSPSFKLIKQFFIEKTEGFTGKGSSLNNSTDKTAVQGSKKVVNGKKKVSSTINASSASSTSSPNNHAKVAKSKFSDSKTPTTMSHSSTPRPIPSTSTTTPTSSKSSFVSKSSRIAPKAQPTPKTISSAAPGKRPPNHSPTTTVATTTNHISQPNKPAFTKTRFTANTTNSRDLNSKTTTSSSVAGDKRVGKTSASPSNVISKGSKPNGIHQTQKKTMVVKRSDSTSGKDTKPSRPKSKDIDTHSASHGRSSGRSLDQKTSETIDLGNSVGVKTISSERDRQGSCRSIQQANQTSTDSSSCEGENPQSVLKPEPVPSFLSSPQLSNTVTSLSSLNSSNLLNTTSALSPQNSPISLRTGPSVSLPTAQALTNPETSLPSDNIENKNDDLKSTIIIDNLPPVENIYPEPPERKDENSLLLSSSSSSAPVSSASDETLSVADNTTVEDPTKPVTGTQHPPQSSVHFSEENVCVKVEEVNHAHLDSTTSTTPQTVDETDAINPSSQRRDSDQRFRAGLSLNVSPSPSSTLSPLLSLSLSPSSPSSSVFLSPSSLSPSPSPSSTLTPTILLHQSRTSPKCIPKFRKSPTLSRRISVERNKTITLNGKVITIPTLPANSHNNISPIDPSADEGKDYGFVLDNSRLSPRPGITGSPLLASIYRTGRRGSYFFKRKQSTDSLSSLSENETLDTSEEVPPPPPISAADLNRLKETADRMNLSTKRPSILHWRQNYVDDTGLSRIAPILMGGDAADDNLTQERKQKINDALEWLRNELQDMRSQDQALARQLLTIRQDIHQLKLQRCTEEHQNLLDDFKSELEELEEFSDVLDLPHPIYEDNPLKHIGITRHNMSARRFSAC